MEMLEDVVPPEPPDVMFGILPVKVVGNGIEINTYAFIYNGSNSTLVDKQLVESLGISGTKVNDFTLTTMHGSGSRGSSELVSFEVKPLKRSRTIKIDRAWTEESPYFMRKYPEPGRSSPVAPPVEHRYSPTGTSNAH